MLNLVVAYRGMPDSLTWFLRRMQERELNKQMSITVVEQSEDGKWFNLGKIWNCGFCHLRTLVDQSHDVCFHPIDLLAINPEDYYRKPNEQALFLIDSGYSDYWSKAFVFKVEDVIRFNGFTNSNWGWGGEDGNLYMRCSQAGVVGVRRPVKFMHSGDMSPSIKSSHISKQQQGLEGHNLADGLSDLKFDLLDVKSIANNITHITVGI